MTSARPLFFLAFVVLFVLNVAATSAFAADERAQPQSLVSQQNKTADPGQFGRYGDDPSALDLFFLKTTPRLSLKRPNLAVPRLAILRDNVCLTMRMYKVQRKEHFADGENGLMGYSTCELASNYQVRTAVAHVQTADGYDSRSDAPQK